MFSSHRDRMTDGQAKLHPQNIYAQVKHADRNEDGSLRVLFTTVPKAQWVRNEVFEHFPKNDNITMERMASVKEFVSVTLRNEYVERFETAYALYQSKQQGLSR